MTKKEKEIENYLTLPIVKGDFVYVKGNNNRAPEHEDLVEVCKIDEKNIYFKKYGFPELQKRKIEDVRKSTSHLGENPFKAEVRMNSYQIDIWQLLIRGGYSDDRENNWIQKVEDCYGVNIPEVCHNPMVINSNGEEVEYQRGLVWTLEQKKLLIDSIYNNIEIGKFVLRVRDLGWIKKRIDAGKLEHTAFKDLVDGKQRFHAILEFVLNKFPDSYGNLFSDLSSNAQRKFINYRKLTYVELDEKSTDQDVLNTFLAINFTGVPMSKEHIEYVQSIKI